MSQSESKSWDEAVDRLRGAVAELRAAIGRDATASPDEEVAASRLKADVSRLQQSAADLRSKLSAGFDEQRAEFESAFDRERAEQTAGQLRGALEELAGLARSVALDVKAAAESSFSHAEPELKTAVRALEDVAGSAAAWIKAVIDHEPSRPGSQSSGTRPPLDDL